MNPDEFNSMERAEFIRRYSHLFDHSPWVVERAADRRPFKDLHAALMDVVEEASEDEKLSLIRAHPELGAGKAAGTSLTADSQAEQASAALDRLDRSESEQIGALNKAYRERFGFPFIICVRLASKAEIIAAMRSRSENRREEEIRTAIDEIGKIVALRLKQDREE
jgi:2-oxo-4-hydroxy-4-carboxy-5-ureidoimidazoline decarboxylase